MVKHHRSTQRNSGTIVDLEAVNLRHRLREIPAERSRRGLRIASRLLRRDGCMVNHKRLHRIRRVEGLLSPLHASKRGHDRLMARCVVTRPSTRTKSGLWTSSSMPVPMVGGSSSSVWSRCTAVSACSSLWAGAIRPRKGWRY